jgi:hypothetical protein
MKTGDGKVYEEKQFSLEYGTRKCGWRWFKEVRPLHKARAEVQKKAKE